MSLLQSGDPQPVEYVNLTGPAPILLLCDHASNRIPLSLGDLGVSEAERGRHIGYDIGAAAITRYLAEWLDAPALLSCFSRLVVDLNRRIDDPTSMPPVSDGTFVPGNRDLSPADRQARIDALFTPYHNAVADQLAGFAGRGIKPAVLSIHSCTAVMAGFHRPWEIGVLWNQDGRIAEPLMAELARPGDINVGDNQPYSGRDHHGHTLDFHAEPAGLPHVLIEVRQDLIETPGGQRAWAERLYNAFVPVLAALGETA
ncbi:N-formylglutamate amidohydrolase [Lacibacterium aquatile]|uniref:N-formylglutamate amidohydrolase n=1 Tax=Lacibacterium aquatile TaxID=1168082 RepID=A0ABW5DWY7_9PROT